MRHFVIASHAHFASGIAESISLLAGERENVRTLCMYVDDKEDLAAEVEGLIAQTPDGDDLIICTDLLGGSVNNEFIKIVKTRPKTFLVTNMNLPLLIQLLFANDALDTREMICSVCAAEETRVRFVNDLLEGDLADEDF